MLISLLKREWRLCLCQHYEVYYVLFFMLLVTCLFPLVTTSDPLILRKIAPGVIWVATLFALFISLHRLFLEDASDGTLDCMLLLPEGLSWYVFTKVVTRWFLFYVPMIVLTPVIALLYHLNAWLMYRLVLSLLLGSLSLCCIGALLGALTMGIERGGLLLWLLCLPLSVPVLMFGSMATSSNVYSTASFAFLCAILTISITLMPWATAAVLRMNVFAS